METKFFSVLFIALVMILQTGVAAASNATASAIIAPSATAVSGTGVSAGLANPASVYCVQQGYKNEIRNNADGSQVGYCLFPNGRECEEWAFYRGQCNEKNSILAQEGETCAGIANIQCASGLVCTGVANYPDAGGVCKKPVPSVNQPPVISGVSAPTSLQVGEAGKWSVKAYDPENGQLTYSIQWGDEPSYVNGNPTGAKAIEVSQTSTFTHSFSAAGEYTVSITVSDNSGQSAQTTSTVVVGAQPACTMLVDCAPGYSPVFSHYDENGCAVFTCQPIKTQTNVGVSISVQPQEVNIYNSFQVSGKITYNTDPSPVQDSVSNQRNFKVVTSYSDHGMVAAAKADSAQGTIRLAASEGIVETMVHAIFPAKVSATAGIAATNEKSDKAEVSSSGAAKPIAASASVASVAATIASAPANSQERVDYITLSPGESTSVSAYFTPRSTGTKLATITVYLLETACPANTRMGMPCKQTETQVAQASAKVNVVGDTLPPQPPQDTVNGSISLKSGWNMVSVPVDAKVSMNDIASACGTPNYAWQLTSSGYVKVDTMAPGYGYWVKASNSCSFPVSSSGYALDVAPLMQGWNLVGAPGNAVQISDFTGTCQITSGPWYYSHDAAATSQYVYSASLVPGNAYWIKASSACRLSGPNIDAAPPAPPA